MSVCLHAIAPCGIQKRHFFPFSSLFLSLLFSSPLSLSALLPVQFLRALSVSCRLFVTSPTTNQSTETRTTPDLAYVLPAGFNCLSIKPTPTTLTLTALGCYISASPMGVHTVVIFVQKKVPAAVNQELDLGDDINRGRVGDSRQTVCKSMMGNAQSSTFSLAMGT